MSRKHLLSAASLAVLLSLLIAPLAVSAHQQVEAGNYVVEYGWVNEPALANQPNALVVNFSAKDSGSASGDFKVDVSAVKIEVDYGGQSKVLALQPLPDGPAGQYTAPFVPTKPGQYTVKLTGKVTGSAGDSDLALSVNPEDVETVDAYAFPALAADSGSSAGLGLAGWLGIGGLVAGLAGLALGAAAFFRK